MVAWDHVSWPGNDYWIGAASSLAICDAFTRGMHMMLTMIGPVRPGKRCTDDGVKAAATDTMRALTGVEETAPHLFTAVACCCVRTMILLLLHAHDDPTAVACT